VTRVVALRALGLGDLLASVPALRGLRRAWPGATLTLAGPAGVGGWLADLGVVDDLVAMRGLEDEEPVRARAGAADVAVNLHGRGPRSHRLLTQLRPERLVAYSCPEAAHADGPVWRAGEHEVDRWIRLSQWAGGACTVDDLLLPPQGPRRQHVVVHPGAASASRCWPMTRWAEVAARLASQGHHVVVTGTAGEAARCAAVARAAGGEDRCGLDDLAGLAHLVGTAQLVLCGDTGVAHLATAFRTPSVTLFGPVSPALWGPRVDRGLHRVLWRGTGTATRPGDPHGDTLDERLAAICVEEVVDAALALLREAQALGAPTATGTAPACASSTRA
jgi:ADP-heptose:LPS heptosyltransferase